MGSSCSHLRPRHKTSAARTTAKGISSSNQDKSHSGRLSRVNPLTTELEGLSLHEVRNDGNKDERTEEKIPSEASQIPDEEAKKSVVIPLSIDVEDDCPICLEEYSAENPKLVTECKHGYHYACILGWMDRSLACPMCSEVTLLDTCSISGT